jgi:sulfur carrier protein
MVIQVNGEPQTIARESISVAELLVLNKVELPDMVSVQLNGEFVDKSVYVSTTVAAKDEIDFLYFMGGGA